MLLKLSVCIHICSAVGLAFGKEIAEEEKLVGILTMMPLYLLHTLFQASDPFKLKGGGVVDMADLTPADMKK